MADALPTLWHINVSHYSEKTRWALAWKDIEHRRRSPMPSSHMAVALWLTRGRRATFPVLTLDGRPIGDSTAIIAALEERFPEPPLYPADPEQRRRALKLEDFFDEQLGPPIRQLVWHELSNDPRRFALVVEQTGPASLRRFSGAAAQYGRLFTRLRFGAGSAEQAERSRASASRHSARRCASGPASSGSRRCSAATANRASPPRPNLPAHQADAQPPIGARGCDP